MNTALATEFLHRNKPIIESLMTDDNALLTTYEELAAETPAHIKYEHLPYLSKSTAHVGQLKLLCSEIKFLTDLLPTFDSESVVVYAGSAPNNKLSLLQKLFPNVIWFLVDPSEHVIMYEDGENHYSERYRDDYVYLNASPNTSDGKYIRKAVSCDDGNVNTKIMSRYAAHLEQTTIDANIIGGLLNHAKQSRLCKTIIHEEYFTDELADIISYSIRSNLSCPFYFISDIRSKADTTEDDNPRDIDVLFDSALVMSWLSIMKPDASMLKFRTPYFQQTSQEIRAEIIGKQYMLDAFEKIHAKFEFDIIDEYDRRNFKFFKPTRIDLQAFAGVSSSETRLIIHDNTYTSLQNFGLEYENVMFYYNKFRRVYPYYEPRIHNPCTGYDGCTDCAMFYKIADVYGRKYGLMNNFPAMLLEKFLTTTRRSLKAKDSAHGYFYRPFDTFDDVISSQRLSFCVTSFRSKVNMKWFSEKHNTYHDITNWNTLACHDDNKNALRRFVDGNRKLFSRNPTIISDASVVKIMNSVINDESLDKVSNVTRYKISSIPLNDQQKLFDRKFCLTTTISGYDNKYDSITNISTILRRVDYKNTICIWMDFNGCDDAVLEYVYGGALGSLGKHQRIICILRNTFGELAMRRIYKCVGKFSWVEDWSVSTYDLCDITHRHNENIELIVTVLDAN